jgi:Anti-sigma-K factor rskA/Putative zinc-finger
VRLGGGDPHTLAGAYAMDAVAEPDRARFERHLAGCESCRQEIRGLREATAVLAAGAAVQPPPALRDAALRAAAQTRQLPPSVLQAAAGWTAPRDLGRRRWMSRLAVSVAGALAAFAVAAGVVTYGMQHRLDQAQLHDHAVAAVLSAPDATMLSAPVSTGGTATVVMSHRERALVFAVADLRTLPAAQSYELWLIGPAGSRPAGMIPGSSRGGMAGPMVISGLAVGDSVGMTVEPTGGSSHPTSPPVVLVSLTGQHQEGARELLEPTERSVIPQTMHRYPKPRTRGSAAYGAPGRA